MKERIKRFLRTLSNQLKPAKFGRWDKNNGVFKPHKCSQRGCKRWATHAWIERRRQLYGCYYHPGPYTGKWVE